MGNFKKTGCLIFQQFPFSLLLIFSTSSLWWFWIYADGLLSQASEKILATTTISLILAFITSVGVSFLAETFNFSKLKSNLLQLFTVALAFLFYYFYPEDSSRYFPQISFTYTVIPLLGACAFVFVAPFLKTVFNKKNIPDQFYTNSYQLVLKILLSIIVGVATLLLGFAALGTVFTLFNLEFLSKSEIFPTWAVFALAFLLPIFFLANLVNLASEAKNKEKIVNNKFYSFLVNYLGIPAILLYFLILYAYTIKVLLNFNAWPQGEISWLVLVFSVFGYLIYFGTYIFRAKFRLVKFFRKVFPFLVLPQILMLFYAILLRINQYDFTVNRYLVVAFGVWLLTLSLYFIFSKQKSLIFLPASLIIFSILISIGPWSVYSFPEKRQQASLALNLKEANILQGNKITPLAKYDEINPKLSGKIQGSIEYLCITHGCDSLNFAFGKEIVALQKSDRAEFEKNKKTRLDNLEKEDPDYLAQKEAIEKSEYFQLHPSTIATKLSNKIKVRKFSKNTAEFVPKYLYFESAKNNLKDFAHIAGYDFLVDLSFNCLDLNKNMYSLCVDPAKKELALYQDGEILETFLLREMFESLSAKVNQAKTKSNNYNYRFPFKREFILDQQALTFETRGTNFDLKLVFSRIPILNPEWEKLSAAEKKDMQNKIKTEYPLGAYGYALLKVKK